MIVWQIKTPSLGTDVVSPDKEVVRWQFKDEETAKRFMEKIHLEKIDTTVR
jgi:hypothetical protein